MRAPTSPSVGLVLLVLAGASGLPPASAAGADGGLAERIDQVRPAPEAWQRIPWRTGLAAARAEAAALGRPVFVWAMNGNPLGCT